MLFRPWKGKTMKRNLLSILFFVSLSVNIVMSVFILLRVEEIRSKTAQFADRMAAAGEAQPYDPGEITGVQAPEVSLKDMATYTLTSMTIPFMEQPGEKQRYMVCTVSLALNKKHKDYGKISKLLADGNLDILIRDIIDSVVCSYTEKEAREETDRLKADILSAVRKLTDSEMIFDVYFSDRQFY